MYVVVYYNKSNDNIHEFAQSLIFMMPDIFKRLIFKLSF